MRTEKKEQARNIPFINNSRTYYLTIIIHKCKNTSSLPCYYLQFYSA
jgi:hypothetical protein